MHELAPWDDELAWSDEVMYLELDCDIAVEDEVDWSGVPVVLAKLLTCPKIKRKV